MKTMIARASFCIALTGCLWPLTSPPVALLGGMMLALTIGNPFRNATQRIARILLQVCIVLLGFGMNLPLVLRAGVSGAAMAAITIVITISAGWLIGRWLSMRLSTVALICAGTAICGGSAIAAVGSALDADEGDITIAMGTVFLLNAAALFIFPAIGHAMQLDQQQFGTWAGVGIHDVSSVVGAAGRYGTVALQTATAVKLSRTLWIIPLTIGMSLAVRGRRNASTKRLAHLATTNATFGFETEVPKARKLQIPWFIGLFLLASIVRSAIPSVTKIAPTVTHLSTIGLTVTLFLIGAGLTRKTLVTVGWKALVLGSLLWILIAVTSLAIVEFHWA